jgi:hypothetical protein
MKLADRVHNGQDILDSRDIAARVHELEGYLEDLHRTPGESFEDWLIIEAENGDGAVQEDAAELLILRALVAEIDSCAGDGAKDGTALIRDSYFETYARELAEDIGAIGENAIWPNNCIDWERAARELQYDYTAVDFDGVAYWVRS